MRDEDQEELRDWEDPDLPEGFDVYDYDAARAKRGQRMVLIVFVGALLLFLLSAYLESRPKPDVNQGDQSAGRPR
jgi:hypothetical protein